MNDHPFEGGDQLKRFVSIGYLPVPAYCFTGFVLYPDGLGDIGDTKNTEPDEPIIVEAPK